MIVKFSLFLHFFLHCNKGKDMTVQNIPGFLFRNFSRMRKKRRIYSGIPGHTIVVADTAFNFILCLERERNPRLFKLPII